MSLFIGFSERRGRPMARITGRSVTTGERAKVRALTTPRRAKSLRLGRALHDLHDDIIDIAITAV